MIFHLAIPTKDLGQGAGFYQSIGGTIGRKFDTHVVINCFGGQLVLHKSEHWDRNPTMYPRHFGVIFGTREELKDRWEQYKNTMVIFEPYFVRRKGCLDEHHTFFLNDPSNNLIEFKWYKNFSSVF